MTGKISIVKETGSLKSIKGYLTTPEVDIENERVSREAYPRIVATVKERVKAGKPVPLFIEHRRKDYSLPVGKIMDAGEDSYGCWFTGVVSSTPVGETVWSLAKEGILYGISIGGDAKDYRRVQEGSKNIREITDLEFREASFTGLPVNPGSYFEIAKSLDKEESEVKEAVHTLNDAIDAELSNLEKSFSDRDMSLLKSMDLIKSEDDTSDEYVAKVKDALQNLEEALNFNEEPTLDEKLVKGEAQFNEDNNINKEEEGDMNSPVQDNPNTPEDESLQNKETKPEDVSDEDNEDEYLEFIKQSNASENPEENPEKEEEETVHEEHEATETPEEETKETLENPEHEKEESEIEGEVPENEEVEDEGTFEAPEDEVKPVEEEEVTVTKNTIDTNKKLQSILSELVNVLKDLKEGSTIGKSIEQIINQIGGENMNYLKCSNPGCTHNEEMFEKSSDFVFNFCPACGDKMEEVSKSAEVSAAVAKQPTGDKPAMETDATGDKTDEKDIDFEPESDIKIAPSPTGDKVLLKDLNVQTGDKVDGSSIASSKAAGEQVIEPSKGEKKDKEDSTIKGPRDPDSVAPSTKEFNEYHNYGQDARATGVAKSVEETVAEAIAKAMAPIQKSLDEMKSVSAGRKGVFVEADTAIEKSQKEKYQDDLSFLANVFTGKTKA